MQRHRFVELCLATAVLVGSANAAQAWLVRIDGGTGGADRALAVEGSSTGDVVAAGILSSAGQDGAPTVVKLAGADGAEIWRRTFEGTDTEGTPDHLFGDVVIDSAGDVVIVSTIRNAHSHPDQRDLLVAKLDGATGGVLWSHELNTGSDTGRAVAIDGNDDVFALGSLGLGCDLLKFDGATGTPLWSVGVAACRAIVTTPTGDPIVGGTSNSDFAVARIDGTNGNELWRQEIDGPASEPDTVLALALDASGDVLAAGYLGDGGGLRDYLFAVAKFDGATGTEAWRFTTEGAYGKDLAYDVSVDGVGDVYAFGLLMENTFEEYFAVVKLSGATGSESWRREISGSDPSSYDVAHAGIVDGTGAVFAAGSLQNEGTGSDATVVRIDGTGLEVWRSALDGTASPAPGSSSDNDGALALDLDIGGSVLVAGRLDQKGTSTDFMVAKLDPTDGSTRAVGGQKLLVQDPGDPAKRKIIAVLKDDLLQAPSAGSPHDPSLAGATVRLLNGSTSEEAVFSLPAGPSWKALGNPAGTKGYRYRDKTGAGPCTSLVFKPGKKAKVSCKAANGPIGFTLDEASQGSLALSIRLGAFAPQCARFGGFVITDAPGQFKAKAAPGDTDCP